MRKLNAHRHITTFIKLGAYWYFHLISSLSSNSSWYFHLISPLSSNSRGILVLSFDFQMKIFSYRTFIFKYHWQSFDVQMKVPIYSLMGAMSFHHTLGVYWYFHLIFNQKSFITKLWYLKYHWQNFDLQMKVPTYPLMGQIVDAILSNWSRGILVLSSPNEKILLFKVSSIDKTFISKWKCQYTP